jgi:hypothetical protein
MEKFQIWDPGSGINIQNHISENLLSVFGLKINTFVVADPDPGSGSFLARNPVSGINIPDPQH